MSHILNEKTWLLVGGAVVLGAIFLCNCGEPQLGLLAAFFTILGDLLALLALGIISVDNDSK